jgi:hypothetical protein
MKFSRFLNVSYLSSIQGYFGNFIGRAKKLIGWQKKSLKCNINKLGSNYINYPPNQQGNIQKMIQYKIVLTKI